MFTMEHYEAVYKATVDVMLVLLDSGLPASDRVEVLTMACASFQLSEEKNVGLDVACQSVVQTAISEMCRAEA
ncbi:MAG: hypothetical protein C5B44_05665 [Acidobacteria bacterium]|nr:MAG: hypothetical protein C5B44_05665 [Acidobacteriota bacterium]